MYCKMNLYVVKHSILGRIVLAISQLQGPQFGLVFAEFYMFFTFSCGFPLGSLAYKNVGGFIGYI